MDFLQLNFNLLVLRLIVRGGLAKVWSGQLRMKGGRGRDGSRRIEGSRGIIAIFSGCCVMGLMIVDLDLVLLGSRLLYNVYRTGLAKAVIKTKVFRLKSILKRPTFCFFKGF